MDLNDNRFTEEVGLDSNEINSLKIFFLLKNFFFLLINSYHRKEIKIIRRACIMKHFSVLRDLIKNRV